MFRRACSPHRQTESRNFTLDPFRRAQADSSAAGIALTPRSTMRAMLAHRPEDAYPRITAPTLVLRGEHDCVCPRDWCDEVVRLLPHARLAEIEGHGHETLIKDAVSKAGA